MRLRAAVWSDILEAYDGYKQSIINRETEETQVAYRKDLRALLLEMEAVLAFEGSMSAR